MITITLEGDSWRDILREMSIIEASVGGSRIEDLPERTNIANEERSGQDGPKTPSCPACGKQFNEFDYNEHKWVAMDRKEYCSVTCSIAGRNMAEQRATAPEEPKKPVCAYCGVDLGEASVIDWPGNLFCSAACEHRHRCSSEQTNMVKDCQKCRSERQAVLRSIMRYCSLGPEEMAEILERAR
ncbi:MAG: hypothetical protein WC261_12525 [Synergistaceae bacterium]